MTPPKSPPKNTSKNPQRQFSCSAMINGQDVILNSDGTALFDGGRVMVVSDLHLEKGRALSKTAPMPLYDTDATLDALDEAIKRDQPRQLICLGDSFHRADLAASLALSYQNRINKVTDGLDVIWITGNHDPELPDFLPGVAKSDHQTSSLWFRHMAEDEITSGDVSGHYHPKVSIKTRARRISGKCFVHDGTRLIMPSFGAYTGGLSVFNPAIKQFFPKGGEIIFCHACQVYRYPYSQVITT